MLSATPIDKSSISYSYAVPLKYRYPLPHGNDKNHPNYAASASALVV